MPNRQKRSILHPRDKLEKKHLVTAYLFPVPAANAFYWSAKNVLLNSPTGMFWTSIDLVDLPRPNGPDTGLLTTPKLVLPFGVGSQASSPCLLAEPGLRHGSLEL